MKIRQSIKMKKRQMVLITDLEKKFYAIKFADTQKNIICENPSKNYIYTVMSKIVSISKDTNYTNILNQLKIEFLELTN